MMQLMRFPAKHNLFAFINDASTLKPIPIGVGFGKEEWFESKQEAVDAARAAGWCVDYETGVARCMA